MKSSIRSFEFSVSTLLIFLSVTIADGSENRAQTDSEERLAKSAEYLASDELGGRGLGSQGLELAAQYLAEQFTKIGLDTKRYQGTPFQTFYLGSRLELGSQNSLTIESPSRPAQVLTPRIDFIPLSLSSSGQFDLPLTFVGYGITAPHLNYDDYQGIDVTGHAVIVLRQEPRAADPNSPFDGVETSDFGLISSKVVNAIKHGATAVLLVSNAASMKGKPDSEEPQKKDQLMAFLVKSTAGNRAIPVIHVLRTAIAPLFEVESTESLDDLETQIDATLKPLSCKLPKARIHGETSILRSGKPIKNVVAVLPGHGHLASEFIIVGAHYDHLGKGGWASLSSSSQKQIHNGADDNASGTSTLIEIAARLARQNKTQPLKRSLIFIAFTAEESGLVGSERYVRDPLVPLKQTVAMLNLDMVGRLRSDRLTVYGTGTATQFDELVDQLATRHKFDLNKKAGGQGPSDHASFYEQGIPVLHFFTGLHKEYHRPEDDFQFLNIAGMRRISDFVVDAITEIANNQDRPKYVKINSGEDLEGLEELLGENDGLLSGLKWTASNDFPMNSSRSGRQQAALGVSAKKSPSIEGYLIGNVIPSSAADEAGLREGDVITHVDGKQVNRPDDLVRILQNMTPGQKIVIRISRNGIQLELETFLGSR